MRDRVAEGPHPDQAAVAWGPPSVGTGAAVGRQGREDGLLQGLCDSPRNVDEDVVAGAHPPWSTGWPQALAHSGVSESLTCIPNSGASPLGYPPPPPL